MKQILKRVICTDVEEGYTDVENCVCDSPLCNTAASKQAFATLFAFALFFLSTFIM